MTLAAALCCAMTTTVFTACGDKEEEITPSHTEDTTPADDITPKQVALSFSFYNTQDMLNYCNIEVSYDNGDGAQTVMVTKDNVDAYGIWKQQVTANQLPATFTFSRKVTLKQSVDDVDVFNYTRGYSYTYALYNADGKRLDGNTSQSSTGSNPASGQNVAKLINEGRLDRSYTISFNEKGEISVQ